MCFFKLLAQGLPYHKAKSQNILLYLSSKQATAATNMAERSNSMTGVKDKQTDSLQPAVIQSNHTLNAT